MARGKIFEYAIMHHPTPIKDSKGNEATEKSKLLGEVKRVVATSDKEVAILAGRSIPEEYLDKLDEVEIIIRPFV